MPNSRYGDLTLYRRLLRQARPFWLHIVGIFILQLLSTPLALLTPVPLKVAVDSVVGTQPIPSFLEWLLPAAVRRSGSAVLLLAAGLSVAIAVLGQLYELAAGLLRAYTGQQLLLSFRAQLFRHAQRLSLSYHDSKGTSDSTYRIQYDSPAIEHLAIDGVFPFVTASLTLLGMTYVTARIDWKLALVALTVSPGLYLVSRAYRERLRAPYREVRALESSALSVVQEVLAALRVVKAFGQEDREEERFVYQSSRGLLLRLRLYLVEGSLGLFLGLGIAAGTAAVLYIGVRHVQAGILTLGELLLVMGYLSQLYAPLKTISRMPANLQSSLASAERAFALLDEPQDVPEQPKAQSLSRASGAVAFRNVSFAYGKDHPVLHDISFEIDPGTRVGIMGATGAGKTTLVSLLTRFYDPTAGQILLDGVDLRQYRLADLRNQFAIVLQEPVLFSASIAENIAYARPSATYEEIVRAAKAAHAHEFIVSLPQGYDTQVGERGMSLSGGERQRIALARAFLKDAPILILDEPTSSVDLKTETTIMRAIEHLMHGRTTFLIAHRLSTLEIADVQLVIEHGRLADARWPVISTARHAAAPRLGAADRV